MGIVFFAINVEKCVDENEYFHSARRISYRPLKNASAATTTKATTRNITTTTTTTTCVLQLQPLDVIKR